MKKINFIFFVILFSCSEVSYGQLALTKLLGKDSDHYKLGIGLFLDFAVPISEGDALTFEAGANLFQDKNDPKYGTDNIPLKVGYRYTLNRKGKGFYIEPSLGYNVFGVSSYSGVDMYGYPTTVDKYFKGIIISPGIGYIFSLLKTNFNLKGYYETNIVKGGNISYAGVKISHTFSFKKRNS